MKTDIQQTSLGNTRHTFTTDRAEVSVRTAEQTLAIRPVTERDRGVLHSPTLNTALQYAVGAVLVKFTRYKKKKKKRNLTLAYTQWRSWHFHYPGWAMNVGPGADHECGAPLLLNIKRKKHIGRSIKRFSGRMVTMSTNAIVYALCSIFSNLSALCTINEK